jgi:hypothetical protein
MLLGYIGAGQEFLEIPYRLNILARSTRLPGLTLPPEFHDEFRELCAFEQIVVPRQLYSFCGRNEPLCIGTKPEFKAYQHERGTDTENSFRVHSSIRNVRRMWHEVFHAGCREISNRK